MITKRLSAVLFIIFTFSASLLFLPIITDSIYASSTDSVQGHGAEDAHGEFPGDVPFDRPVEETEATKFYNNK